MEKRYKKAGIDFLGGQTLNIIIGALCFIFVALAAEKAYGMYIDKTNLDVSFNNLKVIQGKLSDAKAEPLVEKEFMITGPKDWYVFVFPYKDDIRRPRACSSYGYCICICDGGSTKERLIGGAEATIASCNDPKNCLNIDNKLKILYQDVDVESNALPIDIVPKGALVKFVPDQGYVLRRRPL